MAIDFIQHTASRLRHRRKQSEITILLLTARVNRLASQAGNEDFKTLDFKAVQKWEGGETKLTPEKLYFAARALSVSPGYFFEGLPGSAPATFSDVAAECLSRFDELSPARQALLAAAVKKLEESQAQAVSVHDARAVLPASPRPLLTSGDILSSIGKVMERRRKMLGLSQPQLVEKVKSIAGDLGFQSFTLSAQQISKYEGGEDRMPPDKFYLLAKALEMPINHFFRGLPGFERTFTPYSEAADEMARRVQKLSPDRQATVVSAIKEYLQAKAA